MYKALFKCLFASPSISFQRLSQRIRFSFQKARPTSARFLLGSLLLLFTTGFAQSEVRTLKIYFTHTGEKAEVTFKKNGHYIPSGLREINRLLRDWRRNEPTRMDPKLLDLMWEVYQKSGARSYIHVVSGYRSPATNAMLRNTSQGVAKNSRHMKGQAVDFYLPDVQLSTLRALGLRLHRGGVGYYPNSGRPFIHLDTGSIRHWPRMTRSQLAQIFPDGKTLHIPSDGKQMPRYTQALAEYKAGSLGVPAAEKSSSVFAFFSGKPPSDSRKRTSIQMAHAAVPSPVGRAGSNSLSQDTAPLALGQNPRLFGNTPSSSEGEEGHPLPLASPVKQGDSAGSSIQLAQNSDELPSVRPSERPSEFLDSQKIALLSSQAETPQQAGEVLTSWPLQHPRKLGKAEISSPEETDAGALTTLIAQADSAPRTSSSISKSKESDESEESSQEKRDPTRAILLPSKMVVAHLLREASSSTAAEKDSDSLSSEVREELPDLLAYAAFDPPRPRAPSPLDILSGKVSPDLLTLSSSSHKGTGSLAQSLTFKAALILPLITPTETGFLLVTDSIERNASFSKLIHPVLKEGAGLLQVATQERASFFLLERVASLRRTDRFVRHAEGSAQF